MKHHIAPLLFVLAACTPDATAEDPFPDPITGGPSMRGAGAVQPTWTEGDLRTPCAWLDGGPNDIDHHNLVVPYRGHLVMPWAPEWGQTGGVNLYDMADPCAPVLVGSGTDAKMRETHAMGIVHVPEGDHAGDWGFVNSIESAVAGGLQVWDLSDAADPHAVALLQTPGFLYPDSYSKITMSLFVQYPWVYIAGMLNGVFVVDASDPLNPVLVNHVTFDSNLKAGGIFALGDVLMVTAAEGSGVELLDISIPDDPQPIPGGRFDVTDADGVPRDFYHANLAGPYALFARKEDGGGPIVYDISDPSNPTFYADFPIEGRSGGYVFWDEGRVFVGGSSNADVIDLRDPLAPVSLATLHITGDLDTLTPWGNSAILSVDDEGEADHATAVIPWRLDPDRTAPTLLLTRPADGATDVPISARIGLGYDEFIEPASAFEGSIRLYEVEGDLPVRGIVSTQENTVHYAPHELLQPGTRYRVEIRARGVADIHGNTATADTTFTFTTAP